MSLYPESGYGRRMMNPQASPPALKQQIISHQITNINNISSFFCPVCSSPYYLRFRLVPCFHVVCQSCSQQISATPTCLLCKGSVDEIDCLHMDDNLYVCEHDGCFMAFLNQLSLQYHITLNHNSSVAPSLNPQHPPQSTDFVIDSQINPINSASLSSTDSKVDIPIQTIIEPTPEVSLPAIQNTLPSYISQDLPVSHQTESFVNIPSTSYLQQDESDSDLDDLL